ncbi:uncharacterized protein KGF55_001709 [Candida pseudojiufengensis]|uniref:uncharacterized protein n=1 Tax=Candida pseudojiufengensis TaxID=497109 RepID=UPI00222423DF|nr:uncharacterized protein KGF55_001709 [Candida pseudojiufengensis]KAI5964640.1 hypothetical protein KGF55_001709 [Candida pseudojiufengensis]
MSKDTSRIVNNALNVLSKLVESDTNISTVDLNLLENLNTNQALNYIKLENDMIELESNGKQLENFNQENEIDHHSKVLLEIEENVSKLENIINELDLWSLELESAAKK